MATRDHLHGPMGCSSASQVNLHDDYDMILGIMRALPIDYLFASCGFSLAGNIIKFSLHSPFLSIGTDLSALVNPGL